MSRDTKVRDNEILADLLSLVGVERTAQQCAEFTDDEYGQALKWAGKEHLYASDNPVRRIPKPNFLRILGETHGN